MSGFPEKGADLQGSPGNFRGSPGNFRGSLGNFRGTPGSLLSSTVRELPGRSPKNFRGSVGNFRESPGTFQKLGEPDSLPATRRICLQNALIFKSRVLSGIFHAFSSIFQGSRTLKNA